VRTTERRLTDFELRAELNRHYFHQHGELPPPGYWLGDTEYLDEVRRNREWRDRIRAARFAALNEKRAAEPKPDREPKLRKASGGSDQSVVQMVRAHGRLTAAQAAEHLNITPGAAQVRLWRAAKKGMLTVTKSGGSNTYDLPAKGE